MLVREGGRVVVVVVVAVWAVVGDVCGDVRCAPSGV